jgi:hypothetical protein
VNSTPKLTQEPGKSERKASEKGMPVNIFQISDQRRTIELDRRFQLIISSFEDGQNVFG